MKNNCPCCGPFPVLRLSHHHNSIIAADDYEAAVLTRQSQHRLELAALDGPQRGGSTAHPQALELPLAGGNRLRLTPHLPHLVGGTAGLQTPGHHAQKQTHNLQAHRHSAQRLRTHLEHLEHLETDDFEEGGGTSCGVCGFWFTWYSHTQSLTIKLANQRSIKCCV